MHDLKVPSPGHLALYADDAAVYVQETRKDRLASKMNRVLPQVEAWYDKWRLKINVSKTKALLISRSKTHKPSSEISLYGTNIPWSGSEKYLGVILDSTIDFQEHILSKIQKVKAASAALFPLLRRQSKLSVRNKIFIYMQILLESLLYACPVWAHQSKRKDNKLNSLQRSKLRTATNAPWFIHSEVIERQLGIIPILDNIKERTIKFYEAMDDHPNSLLTSSIQCPLRNVRKRDRPRDYLLEKPP